MSDRLKEMLDQPVHTGEWVDSPYGPAMVTRPGKISRARVILSYDIHFLEGALASIEKATPSTMPGAIKRMAEKIDVLAKHIDEVLIAYGDTDPRRRAK